MLLKKCWGSPGTKMTLSLVMNECKSLLQSWGRHVLEDVRGREIPQGSVDSAQMEGVVSGNSLGSGFRQRGFQGTLSQYIPF